ncbi:hypothetical protein HPB47_017909 [Ixodes persulcatus]|uniref:Uncharacterized protein n=1 Tax=Ixodes persulcatus TaxID=34615 RepID=A0AC60QMA2_IXOPE|nr:hypothetical protein HPB47_017909 [Ixodes persulcatus]
MEIHPGRVRLLPLELAFVTLRAPRPAFEPATWGSRPPSSRVSPGPLHPPSIKMVPYSHTIEVEQINSAIYALVGEGVLKHLQHPGANEFLGAVRSTERAEKLVAQSSLMLGNLVVPLEQVGPRIVYVSVFRLPPYVPDDSFQVVLRAFGKILSVSHLTYKNLVRVEMPKAMNKFTNVAGHRAMCEYRDMRRDCDRCGRDGHFRATCNTWRRNRCGIFALTTADTTTPRRTARKAEVTQRCLESNRDPCNIGGRTCPPTEQ